MCRRAIGVWLAAAILFGSTANAFQYAFQVTFTDKNNTPYSLSTPLNYLSPRAVARRAAQGIAVDSTDLPVNQSYIDSVLTLTGGIYHESSKWLNMCMILLSDSSQIVHLAGKPFISDIKLVGLYNTDIHHKTSHTTTSGSSPINVKRTTNDVTYYGDTWNQTQIVNGNYLHDNGFKGDGKLIAVLDAGFVGTNTHPGFDSMWFNNRVVDMYNFTFRETDVFFEDEHGTEVLSTMAGNVPGTFVGSAPNAMYALYVSEYEVDGSDQPLELDNMICAAERADSIGADIITESLGYDIFTNPPGSGLAFAEADGKTTVGAKAANIATKKGMLFVASAGNDGSTIPGWGTHVLTPGDADSALTIGSVTQSGIPSAFSGYGPNAAGQVKPDVCTMGEGAFAFNSGGGYGTPTGTSIATPQIAGWAACLWQANPTATTNTIRQAIIRCASHYTSPGAQIGYGVPDFHCTEQSLNVTNIPLSASAANWVVPAPNPFTYETNLLVSPEDNGNVAFSICDMTGKIVLSFQRYMYKGYNVPIALPVQQLPSGIYLLKALSARQQQTLRLEKL